MLKISKKLNFLSLFKAQLTEGTGVVFEIDNFGEITYWSLILLIFVVILIFRELYQIFKQKKRYFLAMENYIEWFVIALVFMNIVPKKFIGDEEAHRHIAAITLMVGFVQLYLLLVRVVPNTPIPVYINMFITVLKTYIFILLCYLAFIVSFAYSFFIIFSTSEINGISR